MLNDIPIACVPGALTREQREQSAALRQSLAGRIDETREHETGYEFRFTGAPEVFTRAAEWITLERRCCPFLVFDLHWEQQEESFWLRLSGPEGTRDFLKAEMPELPLGWIDLGPLRTRAAPA